jgi:hypothetical protein
MRFKILTILSSIFVLPNMVFAVSCTKPKTANEVFTCFSVDMVSNFIPVLLIVAVVTFLAGVVRFVGAGDNEEKRSSGRQVMIYGIIVLFVMVSLWGFVGIISKTFLGENKDIPNYLPSLQS